jgi:hypothetical protein
MADTPTPYVPKEPGDIMLAADWNEMQVRARSELRAHNHSDDAASRIPREGIADKAVDGSKIDPESKLTLKGLTLAGPLKVSGTSQLADIKAALANFSGARLTTTGDLGVGTEAPENAEGWSRVVDVLGGAHAKLSVRAGDIDARLMSHTTGFFGAEPGMIVGTKSAHPLSFVTGGELRARLFSAKAQDGSQTPVADLFPAHNVLRVGSAWTGELHPDPRTAEISNDTQLYKSLMLAGNRSAGAERRVSVWDRLDVNGSTYSHGIDISAEVADHLTNDGVFYRWQGQAYIGVDDNLYIRDTNSGQIRMHFDTDGGVFKTDVLRLGDKWRLSAIGDHDGNDDWLRLMNADNSGYRGGLAAKTLWTEKTGVMSDLRLKDNIREIGDAIGKLKLLRGVSFDWRAGGQAVGLIAQEVEAALPDAVSPGPEGWKGIDTTAVIALLVQAVKEQQAMIDEMRAGLPAKG